MNNEILRGIAILISLSQFVVPALIIGAVLEYYDNKKIKKANRDTARRKAKHELDCEIVGRSLLNTDDIMRTVNEFAKHQKITCKGHFSGASVEKYIREV